MAASILIIAGALFGAMVNPDRPVAAMAAIGAMLGWIALTGSCTRPRFRKAWVGLAIWLVATVVGSWRDGRPEGPLPPDVHATLQGMVVSNGCHHKPGRHKRCALILEDVYIPALPTYRFPAGVTVFGRASELAHAPVGAEIRVDGWLRGERLQSNPGVGWVGRQPWLRWKATATSHSVVVHHRVSATSIRHDLSLNISDNTEVAAFYRAILLGDRRGLSPAVRDAFIDTGTAHLLAISGLHLAVIAGCVFRLLLWGFLLWPGLAQWGRPRVPAAMVTIAFMWAYALVVGSQSHATMRASLFITVYLGALLFARRPTSGHALWVAAAALSLAEPRSLLTPGFQLSFAAAGAIAASSGFLRRLDDWWNEPGRLPDSRWVGAMRFITAICATTLVCQLGTAPIALAWFGQSSWFGLVVNIAVVPLTVLLVVPLGFAWLSLSVVSTSVGGVFAYLAEIPAQWLLDSVAVWAEWLGSSQHAMIPHHIGVLLALSACCLLTLRSRWCWVGGVVAVLCFFIMLSGRDETLELVTLDVGHGDAIVAKFPDGRVMLVDTGGGYGPHTNRWLADYRLIPALARLGADQVDILAITHGHLDHLGAAIRLAKRLNIRELWIPPCSAKSKPVQALVGWVERGGGQVRVIDASVRKRQFAGAAVNILWPETSSVIEDGRCIVGENNGSMVIRVDYAGRRALLSGDIEALTELELVEAKPRDLRADVLKVPHHGSHTSSTAEFISAVRPRWAIISGVSHHVRQRPPHRSVIDRYRTNGVSTFITGEHGAVRVTINARGGMAVSVTHSGRLP